MYALKLYSEYRKVSKKDNSNLEKHFRRWIAFYAYAWEEHVTATKEIYEITGSVCLQNTSLSWPGLTDFVQHMTIAVLMQIN